MDGSRSIDSLITDMEELEERISRPAGGVPPAPLEESEVVELSCHIAGSTGEELDFLAELMKANGAIEAYYAPVFSAGPAYCLSCLAESAKAELLTRLILRHTGASGVTRRQSLRLSLHEREIVKNSPFGEMRFVRVEDRGDVAKYEEKRRVALERDLTLREIDRILDSVEDFDEE